MTGWQIRDLFIPEDHPSAVGHFPGNPIIPGALLLDEVLVAMAADDNITIRTVKFLRPVRHGSQIKLRWRPAGENLFRFECLLAAEVALSGMIERVGGPR